MYPNSCEECIFAISITWVGGLAFFSQGLQRSYRCNLKSNKRERKYMKIVDACNEQNQVKLAFHSTLGHAFFKDMFILPQFPSNLQFHCSFHIFGAFGGLIYQAICYKYKIMSRLHTKSHCIPLSQNMFIF